MVAVLDRPALLGCQVPRIRVVPEGEDHPRWNEVVDFVSALGIVLDPWQLDALRLALRRAGDIWAALTIALCLPRQNGKNGIVEVRQLVGARILGERFQIHTAHEANTSDIGFQRIDDLIDANAWLSAQVRHIWRANGKQAIEFMDGNTIRFRTRTRGGGRGFSGSPVYFDEAMYLPEVSMGAILPVISAQPDPQIWYTGSAVDQMVHEDGVTFARARDRALAGDAERLLYLEWSVDEVSPDMVDADLASSREAWAAANPAFGIRITEDYLRAEIRELASRTFAVERLGVGDWPSTDGTADTVIDLEAWRSLADPGSVLLDPVWFAFDVSPNRASASIAAAGLRADGLLHVEIAERRDGTGWLPARLAELAEKHSPSGIVCDATGPVSSLLPELLKLGVVVEDVSGPEHANACGLLVDLVEQRRLRHLGSIELVSALKGAATRPLGERWAWARKKSSVDITPLVAATLAVWKADTDSSGSYMLGFDDEELSAA